MPKMYSKSPWWRVLLCAIGWHEITYDKADWCLHCVCDKRTLEEWLDDEELFDFRGPGSCLRVSTERFYK